MVHRVLVIALAVFLAAVPSSARASIQQLPTPLAFVSNLDLECFATSPHNPPPLSAPLVTSHLNPVLANLPAEPTPLGQRVQLCVPVAKNNIIPPPGVLDFIRFVDLACYRTTGQTVNFPLTLSHLNPLLRDLPRRQVMLVQPEQLCLPVIKNNVLPPAEIFNLIRFIDLKCYRVLPQAPLNIGLTLTQLNPVLSHIPPASVRVLENRQLCVPVRKNTQAIPAAALNIIRWIDLEKFDILAPPLPTSIGLTIRHINPLLANAPAEPTFLIGRQQLALPMAKNGLIPPG